MLDDFAIPRHLAIVRIADPEVQRSSRAGAADGQLRFAVELTLWVWRSVIVIACDSADCRWRRNLFEVQHFFCTSASIDWVTFYLFAVPRLYFSTICCLWCNESACMTFLCDISGPSPLIGLASLGSKDAAQNWVRCDVPRDMYTVSRLPILVV